MLEGAGRQLRLGLSVLAVAAIAAGPLGCSKWGGRAREPLPPGFQTGEAEIQDGRHYPWVKFGRQGCYGPCPVYSVEVEPDGRITWNGKRYVVHKGEATKQLPEEKLRELEHLVAQPWIRELERDCCGCIDITDEPSVEIELFEEGRLFRIFHNYGCESAPAELKSLEESIDRIVGVDEWVGPDEERKKAE